MGSKIASELLFQTARTYRLKKKSGEMRAVNIGYIDTSQETGMR